MHASIYLLIVRHLVARRRRTEENCKTAYEVNPEKEDGRHAHVLYAPVLLRDRIFGGWFERNAIPVEHYTARRVLA